MSRVRWPTPPKSFYPIAGIGIGTIALVLLLLLASAATNTALFDQYFSLLYQANLVAGVLLLIVVLGLLAVLLTRLYKKRFGARLMAKLAFFFAVVGVLPGAILYIVSLQFVSRNIESWFDVRVANALEASIGLGRTAMDNALALQQQKAQLIAAQLAASEGGDAVAPLALARLAQQFDLAHLAVVDAGGRIVASTTDDSADSGGPSSQLIEQARQGAAGIAGAVEADSDDGNEADAAPAAPVAKSPPPAFRLRALARIPGYGLARRGFGLRGGVGGGGDRERFVQIVADVPAALARDAVTVEGAYRDYQQIALGKTGLRKMYLGTLTLALFLALFVAVALAVLLGRQLARPLLLLVQGTKEVADGDLSPKRALDTPDELGQLTREFSAMTRQLFEARAAVEHNRAALQESNAYLESILSNLTAGVFVFDHDFALTIANAGAGRIFQRQFGGQDGAQALATPGLAEFVGMVRAAFDELDAGVPAGDGAHWQKQFELPLPGGDLPLTLLVRGTRLPAANDHERGYVVVFDDISDVIAGQRSIAWGEVARRLAHEIKNPLTPIQLSAERLQMKLAPKLDGADAEVLARGATTIVNQVAAMKRMVDDFRDYAKTPPAQLQPLQLNELVAEVLHLYGIDDPRRCTHPVIRVALAEALPTIDGDSTQLRQVIHNLLQNAQDAVADRADGANLAPQVSLATEALHYADGRVRAVQLTIADNGPGFAPRILQRAFEPYVTTKAKGTGLGLAMVKKIIDEHGARIELRNLGEQNEQGAGARVTITFALRAAPHSGQQEG